MFLGMQDFDIFQT